MNKNRHEKCPIAKVAILLSDPWTMLIIRDLIYRKNMRFSDLENSLEGISTRTLIKKIKILEKEKILCKKDNLYYLSEKGKGLKNVIKSMFIYGKKYYE